MDIKNKWANNKPRVLTQEQLFSEGKAIQCEEPKNIFGFTPVWTINIFGVHEFHFLSK